MLGKKLYKTSMINVLRLTILVIVLIFLNDFILDTYTYEKFQADGRFKIFDVIQYHFKYPHEFIIFFFLFLAPAFYYSLVRGTRFFERGFIFNRGFPFLGKEVLYTDIRTYKLLHPNHIVSIHTKSGEMFLIADNTVERVIAILDQHNIQGDLARDDYTNLITNFRKFVLVILTFTVFIFTLKKLGVFAY